MKLAADLAASLVSFTRIPFPWRLRDDAFQRASWHLPLIGWLNVLLLALVLRYLPIPEDGLLFLCLLLPILISGGMHEDGLADAADGLLGGTDREKRLAIMKDPRVGSFGVMALVLLLLGQFLALRTIPADFRLSALAFALPTSRWIASLLAQVLPYARSDAQSRASAYLSRSFFGYLWPTLWTVPAFLTLDAPLPFAFVLFGLALFLGGSLAFFFHRKLSGITGDCLGAAVKIAELIFLWAFALCFGAR